MSLLAPIYGTVTPVDFPSIELNLNYRESTEG